MGRSNRLFEIIQLLRAARRPMTACALAVALEVTKRTIYRDIAALQSMHIPIAGEAGVGYVMRRGFDLPPLMFDADEVEAIAVGLALLHRTGDRGLRAAAASVGAKIGAVLPAGTGRAIENSALRVSGWGAAAITGIDMKAIRGAIRDERKLLLHYADGAGSATVRKVKPIAIVYYIEVVVLAGWCELRGDFRHFRLDRVASCKILAERFAGDAEKLRALWALTRQFE